jgi:hypothetical protein
MEDEDNFLADLETEEVVVEETPPQYTPAQVKAMLDAERQAQADRIEARDQEWREYIEQQNTPDDEPSFDPAKIKAETMKAAVSTMSAISRTQEMVLEECSEIGPEAVKMAKDALNKLSPEYLANTDNAAVITGLILREVRKSGKLQATGPKAGNNGVSGAASQGFEGQSAWEQAFGAPDAETKAALKAAGAH